MFKGRQIQGQSQAGELKISTFSLDVHFQLQLPSLNFCAVSLNLHCSHPFPTTIFQLPKLMLQDAYLPSGSRSNCYYCCLQHLPLSFFWNHDASFGYSLCCTSFNQNTIKQGKEFPKCFSCLQRSTMLREK